MSVHATTFGRDARLESLSTNRSLFAASVAAASLLLLVTGFQGQPLTTAQAQSFESLPSGRFQQGSERAIPVGAAPSQWSAVEPDAEPAPSFATPALERTIEDAGAAHEPPLLQSAVVSEREAPVGESVSPSADVQVVAGATNAIEEPRASRGVSFRQAPATAIEPQVPAPEPGLVAVSLRPLEAGVLAAINARRSTAGLKPVAIDPILTEVSRQRSSDMARREYFSHTTPEGASFIDSLYAVGITTGTVGEILGRNNAGDDVSVDMVTEAFTRSPSHNLHLVYGSYEWAGIGVAVGANNMKYYTIIFRAPA